MKAVTKANAFPSAPEQDPRRAPGLLLSPAAVVVDLAANGDLLIGKLRGGEAFIGLRNGAHRGPVVRDRIELLDAVLIDAAVSTIGLPAEDDDHFIQNQRRDVERRPRRSTK